ncbi:MAG: DNA mismatch repair endonuclease MutL [Thiohalomonadaceae bacterium]
MLQSSRRIRLLDSLLANQIAAGEVVERPASVLKELLENSIDAGARWIEIDVEQGGVALIRVQDDGVGIVQDDLPLALAPQATSKVYTQDELMQVASLGFRGEALASIASISRFVLRSRSESAEHGYSIAARDGIVTPCAHSRGSTVEVRDLFYNVPARRKFLRAERTEFEHLFEVVRRVALSHFEVAITLHHNNRQVLAVRSARDLQQREQRLAAICGRSFVQHAVTVDFAVADLQLTGWLLKPDAARAQADLQYFYLNGRMIRDRLVMHAVRQAYGDELLPGRHSAYVLYLQMPPALADVNVHPAKQEVRFREVRQVHDFLHRALRTAIDEDSTPAMFTAAIRDDHQAAYRPAAITSIAPAVASRQLGVIAGRFLLLDEETRGLALIDLPAVRARQAAKSICTALAPGGQVRSLPLLLPIPVELTAAQASVAQSQQVLLSSLGFVLESLGPQWIIRQIPAALRQAVPVTLVYIALQQLAENSDIRTLSQALASSVQELPERAEWDGLIAAARAEPVGVMRLLAVAELESLLR